MIRFASFHLAATSHARAKMPVPTPLFFASKPYSMDLNFVRRNLRSFLRIPENVTPGVTASLPTALGGSPPEVQLVRPAQVVAATAPAAPVASKPTFRRAPVDGEGFTAYQRKMQHEARLKSEFGLHEKLAVAGMKSEDRRKVLGDFDRYVAARPMGKAAPAPATVDDDGQTPAPADPENPPGIDGIITQLLDLVLELKKQLQITADDDAETVAALGLFGAGKKLSASRALMAVTKKMCERPKLTPAQKISRGFSAQSGVQAIQACLRPGPRQHTAPAAVAVSTTPAAAVSPSGSRDRVQALRAEIAQLDREQRKQFSNERHARHSALSRELKAELRKFHVQ